MWNILNFKKNGTKKNNDFASRDSDSTGVAITLDQLIHLRNKVFHDPIDFNKKSHALFSGSHLTKIRGRGIEFDATREYQPGDDIRRMAWRVTARSLTPHIKVYQEEKERPVWLALDLSPSLYFGTRAMFKSVSCIKKAALLGWSYLQQGERIGACIATPNKLLLYTPKAQERAFLQILKSFALCSNEAPAFTENNCLNHLLVSLQQQIRSGNSLFILSDFLQFDTRNKQIILQLAQRAQVTLIFVYDHFEAEPPPAYRYTITDGQKTALFNTESSQNQNQYRRQFQEKLNELIVFSRDHNIIFKTLRTDQE